MGVHNDLPVRIAGDRPGVRAIAPVNGVTADRIGAGPSPLRSDYREFLHYRGVAGERNCGATLVTDRPCVGAVQERAVFIGQVDREIERSSGPSAWAWVARRRR